MGRGHGNTLAMYSYHVRCFNGWCVRHGRQPADAARAIAILHQYAHGRCRHAATAIATQAPPCPGWWPPTPVPIALMRHALTCEPPGWQAATANASRHRPTCARSVACPQARSVGCHHHSHWCAHHPRPSGRCGGHGQAIQHQPVPRMYWQRCPPPGKGCYWCWHWPPAQGEIIVRTSQTSERSR